MSAAEIIEQIKTLPPEEKARIVVFVNEMETTGATKTGPIRYASLAQVKAAGEEVLREHEEIFRRLAK